MKKQKSYPITAKQKRFAEEYVIDLNGKQAAIRAGYSEKTAEYQAARLLRNAKVQEYIAKLMQAREKRTEITQDMVVRELAKIAFGDLRGVMSWGANGVIVKESSELTDDEAAFISELNATSFGEGVSIKLKTFNKEKALELLGKHLGMFRDKVELTGKDGSPLMPQSGVLVVPGVLSAEDWEKAASKHFNSNKKQ